jgi:hypothetical protein
MGSQDLVTVSCSTWNHGRGSMGRHKKPDPPEEDRSTWNETVQALPVYECQHTGRVVVAGRIQCSGCSKDYGSAGEEGTREQQADRYS